MALVLRKVIIFQICDFIIVWFTLGSTSTKPKRTANAWILFNKGMTPFLSDMAFAERAQRVSNVRDCRVHVLVFFVRLLAGANMIYILYIYIYNKLFGIIEHF